MTPFDKLHGAVQHHIVNSLGWNQLRPLQQAAIEPILTGAHTLCLAPTAGGKTEAAVLPLFSQMLSQDWRGQSVVYVCPIKALLNNLEQRLSHYAGLFGRRVALWHGDVSAATKRRTLIEPADILLTTPESLEVLLISVRSKPQLLFADLRVVVVDELHAFAGSDRGWQLLCLIERLTRVAGRDLQRIGLSATVGNPAELLDWLAGSSQRPRTVIDASQGETPATDVQLDYVGSLANAALVIARLHRGEKRLVFCDSRSQTEDLAYELRTHGVETFVSHSSLSAEQRRQAEQAFAERSNCVIVATSTLELGIDVGDLDRVIQIDAPYTVASFLQRLGRSGRRAGSTRNCLLLATTRESFVRAGALLSLWQQSFVEPVVPPPLPFEVIAQQIISQYLQHGSMLRHDIGAFFGAIPSLANSVAEQHIDALLDWMIDQEYLIDTQELIGIGPLTESEYGRRHYLALISVFETEPTYRVLHGRKELGLIQHRALTHSDRDSSVITLAGRGWRIVYKDEAGKRIFVEPTELKGKTRWFGRGQALSFVHCQAIQNLVGGKYELECLSKRARGLVAELHEQFDWLETNASFLIRSGSDDYWHWWTFAGNKANSELAFRLRIHYEQVSSNEYWIRFACPDTSPVIEKTLRRVMQTALSEPRFGQFEVRANKFSGCIPESLSTEQADYRFRDMDAVRVLFDRKLKGVALRSD